MDLALTGRPLSSSHMLISALIMLQSNPPCIDAGPVAELCEGGPLHRNSLRHLRAAEGDDGRATEDILLRRRRHGSMLGQRLVGTGSVIFECTT